MSDAEKARLEELLKKGNKTSAAEKKELKELKIKAADQQCNDRIAELIGKGAEISPEEQVELAQLQKDVASDKQVSDESSAKTGTFDKTGATSIVTHRDGLKRVWYRDGKEIGVEDANG